MDLGRAAFASRRHRHLYPIDGARTEATEASAMLYLRWDSRQCRCTCYAPYLGVRDEHQRRRVLYFYSLSDCGRNNSECCPLARRAAQSLDGWSYRQFASSNRRWGQIPECDQKNRRSDWEMYGTALQIWGFNRDRTVKPSTIAAPLAASRRISTSIRSANLSRFPGGTRSSAGERYYVPSKSAVSTL